MSHPQILQPLSVLCDTSNAMTVAQISCANLFLGHLADGITQSDYLTEVVRLSVQGFDGASVAVMPMVQLGLDTSIPAMIAGTGTTVLGEALNGLRSQLRADLYQLQQDEFDVQSPVILILSSGMSADSDGDRRRVFDDIMTKPLWQDANRQWQPIVVLIELGVSSPGNLAALVASYEDAIDFQIADQAGIPVVIGELLRIIQGAASGRAVLLTARWVISRDQFDTGDSLGIAARAAVFRLPGFNLPGVSQALCYRQFLNEQDEQPVAARSFGALLDIVALRDSPKCTQDGRHIADGACWPVRIVVADDPMAAVGLIVPEIPARFMASLSPVSEPRTVDGLRLTTMPQAAPTSPGPQPAPGDGLFRARILQQVAAVVALAHEHQLVLGREALGSILWSIEPDIAVLLSECDGICIRDPGDPQGHHGDLVWLAELIIDSADDPAIAAGQPPVLDDLGLQMVSAARDGTPGMGPSAAEWAGYLTQRVVILQGPPVFSAFQVSPDVVPSGHEVTVRWRCRFASSMTISGPDDTTRHVPARDLDDGSMRMAVTRSGPFLILARNQAGEQQLYSDPVHVLSLPELRQIPVPSLADAAATWWGGELDGLLSGIWASGTGEIPAGWPGAAAPSFGKPDDPDSDEGLDALRIMMERTECPFDTAAWFAGPPQQVPVSKRRGKWLRWR